MSYGLSWYKRLAFSLASTGIVICRAIDGGPVFCSDGSHYEKRGKGEPVCIDDEIPFEIPESWEWCRFGMLCKKLTDGSHNPPPKQPSGYPVISALNIKGGRIDLALVQRFTNKKGFERENPRTRIVRGDIILGIIGGSIGNAAVYDHDVEVIAQRSIAIIDTFGLNNYCYWAIQSPLFFSYYSKASGTAQGGVYLGSISEMLIPIPPAQEQKRIILRIQDLLHLVDQYGIIEDARERLDAELPDRLRKSILQLAVQGKLVEQDPADEPASALLDRIRAERVVLVTAKKIRAPKSGESVIYRASDGGYYEKRGKGEPVCIDDEIPFDIPESWEWARMSTLIDLLSGVDLASSQYNDRHNGIPYLTGASNFSNGKLIENRWTDQPKRVSVRGDLLFTCKGTVGAMAINTFEEAHVARQIMAVKPIDTMTLDYIEVFLTSMVESIKSQAKGVIPGIERNTILDALVSVPPVDEQRKIVESARSLLRMLG